MKKGNDVANEVQRDGSTLTLYGKFFQRIQDLADMMTSQSMESILLKDLMPDKAEQAYVFREINARKFNGVAMDFVAWISLAKALMYVNTDGMDVYQVFRDMIASPKITENDIANILYLYSRSSEKFYYYFKFEIARNGIIFDAPIPDIAETELLMFVKFSGLVSQYRELFFWEKKNGKLHPEHDDILKKLLT